MQYLYAETKPRGPSVILATGVPYLLRRDRPAAGEQYREIPIRCHPAQPDPGGRLLNAKRLGRRGAAVRNLYWATIDSVPAVQASAVWGA